MLLLCKGTCAPVPPSFKSQRVMPLSCTPFLASLLVRNYEKPCCAIYVLYVVFHASVMNCDNQK